VFGYTETKSLGRRKEAKEKPVVENIDFPNFKRNFRSNLKIVPSRWAHALSFSHFQSPPTGYQVVNIILSERNLTGISYPEYRALQLALLTALPKQ